MDDLASPTEVTSSNPLRCQHRPDEQERLQRRDELAPQPKEQAATKKDRPDRAPHTGLTPPSAIQSRQRRPKRTQHTEAILNLQTKLLTCHLMEILLV